MKSLWYGFGGQETYGQTVGLSLQPETFWWAILGFVIKGAGWGLLGGAFIGIALERQRHTTWDRSHQRLPLSPAAVDSGT